VQNQINRQLKTIRMKTNLIKLKIGLLLLGFISVLAISSCNKEKDTELQSNSADLSFTIQPGKSTNGLKASDCFEQKASYVNVTIDGQLHKIDVFYIDNVPYTNTIKLLPGIHTIQDFILYNDNMTPGLATDDWVMAAAVHTGALYSDLVTNLLNKDFTVEAFKKNVLTIDLVCYEEAHFDNFGFEYFKLDQTIVREQNFFGDLCIQNINDYYNSPYSEVLGGNANLLLDLPAIFQIEVLRNGISVSTFNNYSIPGIATPLKVTYADRIGVTDNFEFKLSIMVRSNGGFQYEYYHSWTFQDAEKIYSGTDGDGVVDFVLGNCMPTADLVIPPPVVPPPSNCDVTKSNGGGFTTTIQSVVCSNGNYTIVLRIDQDGCGGPTCQELSHYSVEADPGTYASISVQVLSGNMTYTSVVLGPNLGSDPFDGFKIDGTNGIGDGQSGSFIITYTLTGALQDQQVSAKAGTNGQIAAFTIADFISVMNCNQTGCK
jgi:hypothetical protein